MVYLFSFFFFYKQDVDLWLCIDVLDPLYIKFHFQTEYFPSCHEYSENGSCSIFKTSIHNQRHNYI